MNRCFCTIILLTLSIAISPSVSLYATEDTTLGIIGDSIATGAVSSPTLRLDANQLWRVTTGEVPIRSDALPPPTRLWPHEREYTSFYEWAGLNLMAAFSRLFIDTEENSWGYLVGRDQKIAPQNILIAAENGARTHAAVRQVDRLLDASHGVIPDQVMVMFTGNDLCGMTTSMISTGQVYADGLETALDYLLRNGKLKPNGTDVTILAPIGILQLIDSPAILEKRVQAHGKEMSCRELQAYRSGMKVTDPPSAAPSVAGMLISMLPATPVAYCRSLYPPADAAARGEHLSFLANRLRSFRDETRDMVARVNKKNGSKASAAGMRVHWLEATSTINLAAADIAEDCFHLSAAGQAKIAALIASDRAKQR